MIYRVRNKYQYFFSFFLLPRSVLVCFVVYAHADTNESAYPSLRVVWRIYVHKDVSSLSRCVPYAARIARAGCGYRTSLRSPCVPRCIRIRTRSPNAHRKIWIRKMFSRVGSTRTAHDSVERARESASRSIYLSAPTIRYTHKLNNIKQTFCRLRGRQDFTRGARPQDG